MNAKSKTCGNCNFHVSDVNNPQDRKMAELGYKLCSKSDDKMRPYRFLGDNSKACDKHQAKKM
jgi:hypothetical protein